MFLLSLFLLLGGVQGQSCQPNEPGCIVEHVYNSSDCSTPEQTFHLLANGQCNDITIDNVIKSYYMINCDNGQLTGVGNCDATCSNCSITDIAAPTPMPLDGTCSSRMWGGDTLDEIWVTFMGTCPICDHKTLGCIQEFVYPATDTSCAGTTSSAQEIWLLADGNCNPISVGGQIQNYYEMQCVGGELVGNGNCDSTCSNCVVHLDGNSPPLDSSCFARTWGGALGDDEIRLTMSGTCPICEVGTEGCIMERVYGDDATCDDPVPMEIVILADGNCNPVEVAGQTQNYHQLSCQDGQLVGPANCDSTCTTCVIDDVGSDSPALDGTCLTRMWGGSALTEIRLSFTGVCPPCDTDDYYCFAETVHHNDTACATAPDAALTIFADNTCRRAAAGDSWYQIRCDASGNLTGKGNCDDDTCTNCAIADITSEGALPTDGTCFTRPWADGNPLSLTFSGTCPLCVPGTDSDCFMEKVFDAADTTCAGTNPLEFWLKADGNCNPIEVGGMIQNYYQLSCVNGDLVGVGNCPDDTCTNCVVTVTDAPPALDGSCLTRQWGGNSGTDDLQVTFQGSCGSLAPSGAPSASPAPTPTASIQSAASLLSVSAAMVAALSALVILV